MNSDEMVAAYDAKLDGQLLLFPDNHIVLRKTKFQPVNPEFDKHAIIHWWMNVYVPDGYGDEGTPQDVYNSWRNAVYANFNYIHTGGYNPETNQSTISFQGYKKEELQPQIDELRMWLVHVKPVTHKLRCYEKELPPIAKYIKISERTLSEYGFYVLLVHNDEYILTRTTYGSTSECGKFDSLGKAVWFIVNHYWYKNKL